MYNQLNVKTLRQIFKASFGLTIDNSVSHRDLTLSLTRIVRTMLGIDPGLSRIMYPFAVSASDCPSFNSLELSISLH